MHALVVRGVARPGWAETGTQTRREALAPVPGTGRRPLRHPERGTSRGRSRPGGPGVRPGRRSWQPDATTSRWRPGLTLGSAKALGPHYMELYFHDPGCAADFSQILDESGFAVVTLTWPDGVAQMARPGTVPRISHAAEWLAPEGWVIDHVIRRSGRAVQDRSLRSARWAGVPHLSAPVGCCLAA